MTRDDREEAPALDYRARSISLDAETEAKLLNWARARGLNASAAIRFLVNSHCEA